MRKWLIVVMLAVLPGVALSEPPVVTPEFTEAQKTLPLKTVTITTTIGKKVSFRTEMAVSDEERERGMMFRTQMPEDTAMLFVSPMPEEVTFWMKNTLIPLDILFIAPDGRIVNIARNAKPKDLSAIPSAAPVKVVLEIAGGVADKMGIKVGDRVAVQRN